MEEMSDSRKYSPDTFHGIILANGIIDKIDPKTAGFFGAAPSEMNGSPISEYISQEFRPITESYIAKNTYGEEGAPIDISLKGTSGDTRFLRLTKSHLSSECNLIFLQVTDVTDLIQERESMKEMLDRQNLLMDTTRHDITNKLSIAYSYNSILLASIRDPLAVTYLDRQSAALHGIERHLSCMQKYRKAGKTKASWQSLYDSVKSAMSAFDPGLFYIRPENFGYEVYAGCLFENVFSNLFANANKYAEGLTKIQVSARETGNALVISVIDDGKGISDLDKERIFEKGVGKGTGLGLALSREILMATGIRIRESGSFGSGARFEICIPKDGFRRIDTVFADTEFQNAIPVTN